MLRLLLLLFITVPIIEIYVLIAIGEHIGALPTIGLIFLSGILGLYLAKHQGLAFLRSIRKDLEAGKVPAKGLLDGLLILLGAVLLITPGFVTDLFGLLLLLPLSRKFIRGSLTAYIIDAIRTGKIRLWLR